MIKVIYLFLAFQFIGTQFLELCIENSLSKIYIKNQKNNESEEDSNEKSEKNTDDQIELDLFNELRLNLELVFSKSIFQFQSNFHLGIIQDIPMLPPEK